MKKTSDGLFGIPSAHEVKEERNERERYPGCGMFEAA